MLRISRVVSPNNVVTLRLEGQMQGPWIEELHRLCEQFLTTEHRLILDLADVSFVDAAGVELLKELRSHCVTLLSPSPFVVEQLKTVTPCGDAGRLD